MYLPSLLRPINTSFDVKSSQTCIYPLPKGPGRHWLYLKAYFGSMTWWSLACFENLLGHISTHSLALNSPEFFFSFSFSFFYKIIFSFYRCFGTFLYMFLPYIYIYIYIKIRLEMLKSTRFPVKKLQHKNENDLS